MLALGVAPATAAAAAAIVGCPAPTPNYSCSQEPEHGCIMARTLEVYEQPGLPPYTECPRLLAGPDGGSVEVIHVNDTTGPVPEYKESVSQVELSPAYTEKVRTAWASKGMEGACCYQWPHLCGGGRPLWASPAGGDSAAPILAPLVQREDWTAAPHRALAQAPTERKLGAIERDALAAAWREMGLAEHASIAVFARLSLALLAHGAPPELLAETARAARDEIEHAKLCFERASALDGRLVGPGPLPVDAAAPLPTTLAALAVEALHDGAVDELAAAMVAAEGSEQAVDPRTRGILARIARDEERHATLAFRVVAFALDTGGTAVENAVRDALRTLGARTPEHDGVVDELLASEGLACANTFDRARARVAREITVPCIDALLSKERLLNRDGRRMEPTDSQRV